MSRRLMMLSALLIGIVLVSGISAGAQYPDCNWRCTAGDVYTAALYVEAPEACEAGQEIAAPLFVTFVNGTRSDRYAVRLLADLYVGGVYEGSLDECVAEMMAPGESTVQLGLISWSCGQSLELRNVVISWSSKPETCGEIPSCASRTAKCWGGPAVRVAGTPLSVGFAASASVCDGEAVQFTSLVSGGEAPYVYEWAYGDGAASTSANPSHLYPSPGSYSVSLIVTDTRGATGSAIGFVDVDPKPIAFAGNGGPYCSGSTIELYADGGVAYSWSGPNSFSSSEQNPQIQDAAVADGGVYTVTVESVSGCVDQASTLVEVDGAAPDLSVPADVTVECEMSTDPLETGSATAIDDYDPSPVVTFADVFLPGCGRAGTITRIWTATDTCGNSASGDQTILVIDTTPPTLAVSSAQFECDGSGNTSDIALWLASVTATDACGDVIVIDDFSGVLGPCDGVGTVEVAFTAIDACGNESTRSASLAIVDTTPPDAVGDVATAHEDTSVQIDVLANDTDVCDSSPALADVGDPVFGIAQTAGSEVLYTPPAGFSGTDTFSYTIEDCSGNQASPLVEVTVLPVNDSPVANDETATAEEDTPLPITVTATDPDGDTLRYTILSGPTNGTITGFDLATGTLIYTPDANYNGPDLLAFEACDPDGLCDTGTVTIMVEPVDDPPTADPQSLTTPEDTALPITVTGGDIDGDPITYNIVSGPSHGTISGFDPTMGELLYTPDENFTGTDSFVFETCDPHPEHGCAQAAITITVTPVNDPPIANDDATSTPEDTPKLISVYANDFDVDGNLDPTTVSIVSQPSNGTVSIDSVTGAITYAPEADFNGIDTFGYQVCDTDGLCDTATVTVTVVSEGDPPVANDDSAITPEDQQILIDILGNDMDADNDLDPTSVTITVPPTHGSVSVDPVTGEVTYTPDEDFHGQDVLTYQVCDSDGVCDEAAVAITVLPIDDPPVANDQAVTAEEDTPLPITVTATDPDGDTLAYTILSGPANGTITGFDPATGTLIYTPDEDYNGPDSLTFEACDPDGLCDAGLVTITVEPVDDSPLADPQSLKTPEDTPRSITVTGSDADGDPIEYRILSGPSNGTIDGFDGNTGGLIYTPNVNFTGTDAFVFEACDPNPDNGCAQATVTIEVTPANDPPRAEDQTRTTSEDTATGFFSLAISDPDNTLAELTCDCLEPPARGAIERGPSHTVNYTPDPDFSGIDTFRYLVCDPDGLCDTAIVVVTVGAIPDPPVAVDDVASVAEDEPVLIDVVDNDSDPDGDLDPTTVSVILPPTHGAAAADPVTGAIRYTPDLDYVGPDSFAYEVCDVAGLCDEAIVTVTMISVDDPPVAVPDAASVPEDGFVLIDVVANDRDPDGNIDLASLLLITDPTRGSATVDAATGRIGYAPDADFAGEESFEYQICDSDGSCDTALVTITVIPTEDPPIARNDTASTVGDAAVVVDVIVNDYDADGDLDPTTLRVASPPASGTAEANRFTGEITYSPADGFIGTDTFDYEVCDAGGRCDMATVTVVVGPSDNPPIALDDVATVLEDGITTIDILANDGDPDGNLDPTSVFVVSPPARGFYAVDPTTGAITYAPDPNYEGPDTLTYQVCDTDGECDTAIVAVRVTPVDDPPVANDDTVSVAEDGRVVIDIAGNDTDPDGDLNVATVSITDPPNDAAVSVDSTTGAVTYVPNANFHGLDRLIYQICDDAGACDSATITVNVVAVGDPPIANDDDARVDEDGSVVIDVAGNDSDPDGDLDVASVSVSVMPSQGDVRVDRRTGEIVYEPNPDVSGQDAFAYEICDSEGRCTTARVTVDIAPRNDPPTALCIEAVVADGSRTPIRLLGRDSDGDPLTYAVISEPFRGVLTQPDAEGTVYYLSSTDADEPFSGPVSFAFEVCDPSGACDQCVVQLFVVRAAGGGGVGECAQRVIISEVAWAGTDASEAHEWIELRNLEDVPVDLEGWTLRWRRKFAETEQEALWKAIPLAGVVAPYEPDPGLTFAQAEVQPDAWWVFWEPEWRDDFFLLERETDEPILHIDADLVYGDELPLDRVADLDDRGDVIELVDPLGCVVDTANAGAADRDGWVAGSASPVASMERTDPQALDFGDNWHTNLGLVRAEMDAWAQLVHGTPKYENSPILSESVAPLDVEPTVRPMGEPIVLRFDPLPEWPINERLWRVLVTRPPTDEILEAEWTINPAADGATLVVIAVNRLPLDEEIHVWVRTPSGDVLFAPFTLYPY